MVIFLHGLLLLLLFDCLAKDIFAVLVLLLLLLLETGLLMMLLEFPPALGFL